MTARFDHEVIFFNSNAWYDEEKKVWNIPVRGWIYELEKGSVWRNALSSLLLKSRAMYFLAESKGSEKIKISVNSTCFELSPSGPDGHFSDVVQIPGGNECSWVRYVGHNGNINRFFEGRSQLVHAEGLSVISDIDDTIKISEVGNRKRLIFNTFMDEFRPVTGMQEFYSGLAEAGAVFHYVSCSPWQLYPELKEFMRKKGFPEGSFDMNMLRITDMSLYNIFSRLSEFKIPVIESILRTFPRRKYIYIGDSGEYDPEIYGEMARKYPETLEHIYIRLVSESGNEPGRWEAAFTGIDKNRWTVFKNTGEIKG